MLHAQTFDVASVKPSARILGRDANSAVVFTPTGVSGHNVTLKRLIIEGYGLRPYQISGPKWLDDAEFDIQAKNERRSETDTLRSMLRALLAERFGLVAHRETKEARAYQLAIDQGGPKVHASEQGRTMQQLADLIALQLSIPVLDDPGKPGVATGASIPVLDKTGLQGTYDLDVQVNLEAGVDMFTLWQRTLQDRLGLKLESKKASVELLVIDRIQK